MENVYVCTKCGRTATAEAGSARFCTDDGNRMTDTNVTRKDWDTYSEEIQRKVISEVMATGKGVDPQLLKYQTEAGTSESKKGGSEKAFCTLEPADPLKPFEITEGEDGKDVIRAGKTYTVVIMIISVIVFFVVLFITDALFEEMGMEESDGTLAGLIIGAVVAFLFGIREYVFGKEVQGAGMAALNTYEMKEMVKQALEHQNYSIIRNPDQEETSDASDQK